MPHHELVPPTGARLAQGSFELAGVTSDGIFGAVEWSRGAIALSPDGTAQPFDGASEGILVRGPALVSYHALDFMSGIADLTVLAKGKTFELAASTGLLVSNEDFLLATANSDGDKLDLVLVPFDGSPPKVLFAGEPTAAPCGPRADKSGDHFLVSHCASATPSLALVDPVAGTTSELLGNVKSFAALPDGSVLAVDQNRQAWLISLDGSRPNQLAGLVDGFGFSSDGSTLVLRSQGALLAYPPGGGVPLELVTGAQQISEVAADGTVVAYVSDYGHYSNTYDLALVFSDLSNHHVTGAADVSLGGDLFTADESRIVYYRGSTGPGTADIEWQPVRGGKPTVLGPLGWIVRAIGGSRILYLDHYQAVPKKAGNGDLRWADLATGEKRTIATGVVSSFVISGNQVAYSLDDGSANAGVWIAPLD